jgi:hypothetical protein
MRSFITTVVVILALGAFATTASARPAVDPPNTAGATPEIAAPVPVEQRGHDLGAVTIVLLGAGGLIALGGGASIAAHLTRRLRAVHPTSRV